MKTSVLTTLDDAISANLMRTKLESEGIPCYLTNENITTLLPPMYNILGSGIQVIVPTDQLQEARIVSGINNQQLQCPNCGSTNLVNQMFKRKNKYLIALMAIFLILPVGNLLNNFTCIDCKHSFKNNF